jgi:transposase
MKKIITVAKNRNEIFKQPQLTIGVDLGDRISHYCILDETGNVILEQHVPTTPKGIQQVFSKISRYRIVLETGTHSPWVSRLLTQLGHEVIVAHARNVQLITESTRKDDRLDARTLARLARIDPEFVRPSAPSQCPSANSSDRDPRSSNAGQRAYGAGECRTRIDEILR